MKSNLIAFSEWQKRREQKKQESGKASRRRIIELFLKHARELEWRK